ncbi:chitinase [Streptomyces sp. NPDC059740]|uniref:chitinase n=1 Tax=Streptomyces sp. NPDC059740 TaxID=3346926 RepID=UPI003662ABDE
MSNSTHRRRTSRRAKLGGLAVAAAVAVGGGVAIAGSAMADKASPGTTSTAATTGGFSPYVDTSLASAGKLADLAKTSGAEDLNLAFVTSGGDCSPEWGGTTDVGGGDLSAQISALRDAGGDVRVSFGGANGQELALACDSAGALADAYGKVVDAYQLKKVDFDVEGGAVSDTAANTRRAQAVAELQKAHPGLDVSFTLATMPTGLTQDGENLLKDAKAQGVEVGAVNLMAMDYGSSFDGDMGEYAEQAATAAHGQIQSDLGLSSDAAWSHLAVTPMIGVNDVQAERFTVADAKELAGFAASRNLAWLSMWSANRDRPCPGGAGTSAQPTCSSVEQGEGDFGKALAGGAS